MKKSNMIKALKEVFFKNMGASMLVIIFFVLSIEEIFGQKKLYASTSLGTAHYLGDLVDNFNFSQSKFAKEIGIGYKFTKNFQAGLSYLNATIAGDDKYSEKEDRRLRNLSFYSKINEISIYTEFIPFELYKKNNLRISPYLKNGIGIFSFNPQAELEGKVYDLQKQSTEGQGLPGSKTSRYSLLEISYIYGLGLKVMLNDVLELNLEISPRLLSTDYLDDVSGYYYNTDMISTYVSPSAAKLSNRKINKGPGEEQFPNESVVRGNSNANDHFVINSLKIKYYF
jgi:hypothetical protein